VKRTEIAVRGAPSTETLRLEVNGAPGEDGLALEFLHDQRQTGTLARVVGGQVGLGEVVVPVAVKLQRDIALSQEERGSVAAKFDKERNVHRRLQEPGRASDGPERVVRQLEIWAGPADHEADSLEPCILCARARHGLAPRCPECDDPAAVLEELELTDDRGLRCPRCQRQFWSTPRTRELILDATLGRDPACRGCAFENGPHPEPCRGSAVFLNFFRNRVLLLERLDLDLDDYLRWGRDPKAAGPRQAARQAFEEHRRLVRGRRDRLHGPSVAKIADLLTAADLFAEIVGGVEHLHRHGVAHLDLKPANVCVRFRGADLDVKIIDLGLSDDPETLAYLRQAEGPLSLWTDYSAPEFRRPRARPVPVDGRFREDACELDWPRSDAPAADLPCPGDLLFFEDRDLRGERFRVVAVMPGGEGGLLVRARAEPRHLPWLGEAGAFPGFGPEARTRAGVSVVLEKLCGFPADVYSLGMLLLAVLAGHPDVGDFREALPGVQIELEEYLRDRPALPGRALVQLLLRRPSKHLHVFHSYAQRLAAFGVARSLAEELLGLVLRATVRGDPRVFYLVDRGGDGRAAMRRLRADLDAVRTALSHALTTAQAVGVRQARLATLDQLRGGLHDRPIEADPTPRSSPEGRLLYPALDLGAAGDDFRRGELAYLPPVADPTSVLDRWERELAAPPGEGAAAGGSWDFLVRYCRRIDLEPAAAGAFLERHRGLAEGLARADLPNEPARAEDRERGVFWVEEFQPLAERLEYGPRFVETLQAFLAVLKDRLLTPWDRALKASRLVFFRRQSVRVPLSRAERAAIRDEAFGAGLEGLVSTVHKAIVARQRRAGDFERALARWRTWRAGRAWLDALSGLEAAALGQRGELEDNDRSWDQGWDAALAGLRDCLAHVSTALRGYDALFVADPAADEVSIRLSRIQREAIDTRAVEQAGAWLRENWPAPSEQVEALFALWELGVAAP
jgi:hypothetical protein